MEITRFEEKYTEQAAELLGEQFARWLRIFPLLPKRNTDEVVVKDFLVNLLFKEESCGMVMLEGNRVNGFLLGAYGDNPFFGRHVMVPFGGMGLKAGMAADTLGKLYTAAGEQWMKDDVLNHYLVMPALPDWLETGYSLSFGKEQAYAIAPIVKMDTGAELPDVIVMREVVPSDAPGLYNCADWIADHYNKAPVWEPVPAEHLKNIRKGYAGLATETESTTWLALHGERIVSFVVIYPEELTPANLLGDHEVAHFSVAATHPDYRGRGIGRALFTHAMNMARQQGYDVMTTDWRTTNPAAVKHWPHLGFVPYAYRLLRRVNPRYQVYSAQILNNQIK